MTCLQNHLQIEESNDAHVKIAIEILLHNGLVTHVEKFRTRINNFCLLLRYYLSSDRFKISVNSYMSMYCNHLQILRGVFEEI